RAGVDDDRVEDQRHDIPRQVGCRERGLDVVLAGIGDEGVGQRKRSRAISHDGDLITADLVTIEAGCLLAARRRGGISRRDDWSRPRGGRSGKCRPRKHGATSENGHCFLPPSGGPLSLWMRASGTPGAAPWFLPGGGRPRESSGTGLIERQAG